MLNIAAWNFLEGPVLAVSGYSSCQESTFRFSPVSGYSFGRIFNNLKDRNRSEPAILSLGLSRDFPD